MLRPKKSNEKPLDQFFEKQERSMPKFIQIEVWNIGDHPNPDVVLAKYIDRNMMIMPPVPVWVPVAPLATTNYQDLAHLYAFLDNYNITIHGFFIVGSKYLPVYTWSGPIDGALHCSVANPAMAFYSTTQDARDILTVQWVVNGIVERTNQQGDFESLDWVHSNIVGFCWHYYNRHIRPEQWELWKKQFPRAVYDREGNMYDGVTVFEGMGSASEQPTSVR